VEKGKRIWPTGCPKTKVNNYQSTQRNIPEEWRSCVHCSGSLKSHNHNATCCCDTGMDIGLLKKWKIFLQEFHHIYIILYSYTIANKIHNT
jgi:hypothetical protein